MADLPFRPLAATLIRRTIWVALACMAGAFTLQTIVAVREHEARVARLLGEVAGTSLPLLSVGLWDIEPRAVQLQVNLIGQRPEVGYVRLVAGTGQRFEAGDLGMRELPPTQVLAVRGPNGVGDIGTLSITGNPGFLHQEILVAAVGVLLGYGAFTVLICVLIAVMLRRQLQQPLERIARFAAELTPTRLMTPLQLDRPARSQVDEIDLVADGFRKLQAGLRGHIANLDQLVAERTSQLEQVMEELRELTRIDALTGCFNRRMMSVRLPLEVERAQRYGRALSIVFADIDHFKQTNDRHGHPAGDAVLRAVSSRYVQAMRSAVDWIARYGGEEFVVVLPETDLDAARAFAERLRDATERTPVEYEGLLLPVTASFGVAELQPGESVDSLLARADAQLYRAKAEGRNRVLASA